MTQNPPPSPTLVGAIERFVAALHAAYPAIAIEGVPAFEQGLFVGEIAKEPVNLFARRDGDRLHLMKKCGRRKNTSYVRFGFKLKRRGFVLFHGDPNEELILLLWLMTATAELEEMAAKEVAQ